MTLNLSVGDLVSNKAGDNKAKVMAIMVDGRSFDACQSGNASIIVALVWNTHEGNPQSNVAWHTLEGMEKLGWAKWEPTKIPARCSLCGHRDTLELHPLETKWPNP